jgi:hypothetical protein
MNWPLYLIQNSVYYPAEGMDVWLFWSVVCCQVEVHAMDRSLFQRSPTRECVCQWVWPGATITICTYTSSRSTTKKKERKYEMQGDTRNRRPISQSLQQCLGTTCLILFVVSGDPPFFRWLTWETILFSYLGKYVIPWLSSSSRLRGTHSRPAHFWEDKSPMLL